MQGGVNYNGNTLLTGGINVNTTGNIQALNVQVTENGERTITPPEGVDGYAPITIDTNVPTPEPALDTLNVSSNGTYTPPSGVDGYDEVIVNVPTPEPVLDTLNVTQNGQYTPPSGVDGYDEVNVNVPTPEPVLDTLNVTSNGTYTPPSGVDGYDEVNVSISGYTIKTPSTTPTSIASFTDGTANPLKSLTVSIVPVQAGSGDPSPTNVRPISGWTEEVITRTGKNMLNPSDNSLIQYNQDGNTRYGVIFSKSGTYNVGASATNNGIVFAKKVTNGVYGESVYISTSSAFYANNLFTITDNDLLLVYTSAPDKATATSWLENSKTQVELNQATTYEPYAGTTTTIPFTDSQGNPVEVYGGEIDVINGVVTPCPYYASYNGEELTGEWLSDRDVYSPNTTPTIGAQVVNIGATGTPFNTQPTSINSLDGENNVFASTGQIEELEYFADL